MKMRGKKSALKIHKPFLKSTRSTSLLCLYFSSGLGYDNILVSFFSSNMYKESSSVAGGLLIFSGCNDEWKL